MNKTQLENIIREFNKSNESVVDAKIKDDKYFYTVKIEKQSLRNLPMFESYGIRGSVDTISALPAGATCRACGGSGIQS